MLTASWHYMIGVIVMGYISSRGTTGVTVRMQDDAVQVVQGDILVLSVASSTVPADRLVDMDDLYDWMMEEHASVISDRLDSIGL